MFDKKVNSHSLNALYSGKNGLLSPKMSPRLLSAGEMELGQ